MEQSSFEIRLMKAGDLEAVVSLDKKITQSDRREFYELKFNQLFKTREYIPTSLVAEENGNIIGFIMGELYMGEYGITKEGATLDTIGVDPVHRHQGIGELLMNEFIGHLRELGVEKVNALVSKEDSQMMRYFRSNQFNISTTTVNMERTLPISEN